MKALIARVIRWLLTPSGSTDCVCHRRARAYERHIGKGW